MFISRARASCNYAKAQVLRAQQGFEEALLQYEQVLALNRNWVHTINGLGRCICCNRAWTSRSSVSRRHAPPIQNTLFPTPTSPPPAPSKGRASASTPNSPLPAG